MGVGSTTFIKFYGKKEDLEKICELAKDGNDGAFYLKVFDLALTLNNLKEWSEEFYNDFLNKVGVNSLSGRCSAWLEDDVLMVETYSTYETPIGCWERIAEMFPEVEGRGFVLREDDFEQTKGDIVIGNGEFEYSTPEEVKWCENYFKIVEDEDESD